MPNSIPSMLLAGLLGAGCAALAIAQTALPEGIAIRTYGEVSTQPGSSPPAPLRPADHVVSGNEIIYTVEIRNGTSRTISGVAVTHPVPEHMLYVADSAAGPAADITFSVDDGRHFGRPEELKVKLADGNERAAAVADYTTIRWALRNALYGNAIAFARFRAVLKK